MQVDRQPSPWPCVAMLVVLVLLCLLAPCYWRSNKPVTTARPAETKQIDSSGTGYLFDGWEDYRRYAASYNGQSTDVDPLHLWSTPTIEELIAVRAGMHRTEEAFRWPVIVPLSTPQNEPPDSVATPPATAAPWIIAAFERAGHLLADYSPAGVLPRLSVQAADLYRLWSSQRIEVSQSQSAVAEIVLKKQASPNPSTLRLVGPEDAAAIAPPVEHDLETGPVTGQLNGAQARSSSRLPADPWCVPQVLLDQLRRLKDHPAAGSWAERTIAQLIALTAPDELEGTDVQVILAALSDSAQEAVHMAEETAEDRLRVELLRAHWGLARRLDCWIALHDIRLAERTGDRVALHGPSESFFSNRPSQVVEISRGSTLTSDLETYERSRDPQLGRNVARQRRALEESPDALDRSLAESVERHYRNANVRIAVTAELLNRLIGDQRSEVRALRDRIAGTNVRGSSHTESGSRIRFEPVAGYWQLTVEATGVVDSNTLADGGSAQLRSRSATDFAARKSVVVDAEGVRLQPTVVHATNHNRLVGVTTDFDWLPLVGSFARDRAVAQYHARRQRAKAEVELRVTNQAADQVDRETLKAVERVERQVREQFTNPLAEAGVDVTPVELKTTRERMVARLRVAGEHQLGSHTPRPRALSDSLASVQVHETALTNAAVSLSLDGGRYSGSELQQLFREKLPRMAANDNAVERDAVFHFAQVDALRCHIHEGRLELAISLAELELDGRTMRDFIVHAYYAPAVSGLQAELERDGSLGIEGRLTSSDRARLHNVFNRVLPPERRLPILQIDNPADPRLEGLMITQLVLEDGWLGLAVGPAHRERVAERSRSLR